MELYIGHLKLHVIDDAFLVELSFEPEPPRQNKLKDLPPWTLTSKNAIWILKEDKPPKARADDGEKIKKALSVFIQ